MSVTFSKLTARVYEDLEQAQESGEIPPQVVAHIVNRVFYHIGDALASGEDVYLEGFGRFHPDCKPPRKVKSGLTSEVHTTEHKVFVRFNAFKQLNTRVQRLLHSLGVVTERRM